MCQNVDVKIIVTVKLILMAASVWMNVHALSHHLDVHLERICAWIVVDVTSVAYVMDLCVTVMVIMHVLLSDFGIFEKRSFLIVY